MNRSTSHRFELSNEDFWNTNGCETTTRVKLTHDTKYGTLVTVRF